MLLLCGCKQLPPYRAANVVPAATPPAGTGTPIVTLPAATTASGPAQTPSPTAAPTRTTASPRPLPPTPVPQPDLARVWDVSFVDANHGWATGDFCPNSRDCRPALWHTADGGRIWHETTSPAQIVPMQGQDSGPDASQVLFATTNDGWLYGQKLYVTHDAGTTWAATPALENVETMTYADGVTWAFLRGACTFSPGPTRCERTVMVSSDAGRSWRRSSVQPALSGPQLAVLRVSAERAWAISGDAFRTDDGGATWQPFQLPPDCASPPYPGPDLVALALAERVLWLKCSWVAGAGNERREMFRSQDGGDTWVPAGTGGHGYSGPIAATSANSAFMCGSRMVALRTTDAGRTWQPAIAGTGGEWFCHIFLFVDADHGWFVTNGDYPFGYSAAIWRTEDGGAHWQRVGLP